MEAKLRILAELVEDGRVTEEQAECWRLFDDGWSGLEVCCRLRLGRRKVNAWYAHVDDKIEQVAAHEGKALAGMTLYRPSAPSTNTPFVADPVLVALGFEPGY